MVGALLRGRSRFGLVRVEGFPLTRLPVVVGGVQVEVGLRRVRLVHAPPLLGRKG